MQLFAPVLASQWLIDKAQKGFVVEELNKAPEFHNADQLNNFLQNVKLSLVET